MADWKLYTGLSIAAGIVVGLGIKKFREISGLKLLQVTANKPVFQFVRIKNSLVDAVVHLIVKNPTKYSYQVKDLFGSIYLGNDSSSPNTYLASVSSYSGLVSENGITMLTIPITFSLQQLFTLAKNIFFNGTSTIFLTGSVTYVTSGVPVPVPFSFSVDVRDQLNAFLQQNQIPVSL